MARLAFFAIAPHAQEYPTKPVRIIVPFAAGGPADIYARFIGQLRANADAKRSREALQMAEAHLINTVGIENLDAQAARRLLARG